MNRNRARSSPLLASPQGGVAASSKKFRVATKTDAAAVVFLRFLSENHPGFAISGCFAIFFDRSATPPCGDARRGLYGLIRINSHLRKPLLPFCRYSPAWIRIP
jgi:hypothetical protein